MTESTASEPAEPTTRQQPRVDPVGTVRRREDGVTAVKVSMGDDTGKGQHVWCWMAPSLEVRWLHHYEVADWPVLGDFAQTTELAEAQRSAQFWQGQAENWEREHQNTVLPYTTKLETERDALQARADAALAEIANWWGTGKTGGRTLMAVNSILRGHVDAALVEQPPVQPLHWRTEDGGIAAVMCSACNTLGGHDDDCPRRQPPAPFVPATQAFPEEKP